MSAPTRWILLGLVLILMLAHPGIVAAGMASPTLADVKRALGLSDMSRMRLE